MSPQKICKFGLTRTFQIVETFIGMTITENVMIGAFSNSRNVREVNERALEILRFVRLFEKKDFIGKSLNICDRKRLEIARALATEPKLLMIDEGMAGLNMTEINENIQLIQEIRSKGITLLIVEHVMEAIMPVADRIVVLDSGKKIAEGKPTEIANDEAVIKAYLGEKYHARRRKSQDQL
jgi:branched-chain amino acid transport system ATP-binding protein